MPTETDYRHFVIWESDSGTVFHRWSEHTQELSERDYAEGMAAYLRSEEAKSGNVRNVRVIHRLATEPRPAPTPRHCSVPGCENPPTSRSAKYCADHRELARQAQREAAAASLKERWAEWKKVPQPEDQPPIVSKPGRLGYTGKLPPGRD